MRLRTEEFKPFMLAESKALPRAKSGWARQRQAVRYFTKITSLPCSL
jgi:hypothetical protein